MSEAIHPCKWHEGDTPIEQDPDPELYSAPGCQGCGAMLSTKDCESCGQEFLDWEDKSYDDVIAGPYVTTSGDLYCMRCGPREDGRAEAEEDREFSYSDFDYGDY